MKINFMLEENESFNENTDAIKVADALITNSIFQDTDKLYELSEYLMTYSRHAQERRYRSVEICKVDPNAN